MGGLTLADLLSRLDGARRSGNGWTARCPGHEDQHNSLSLAEDEDTLLLHCFAGCDIGDVLAALGLSVSDLFPGRRNGHTPAPAASPTPAPRTGRAPRGLVAGDPLAWLAEYCAVPSDFIGTLPLEADGDQVAFRFGDLEVRKLRRAGTKDFAWLPAGVATPLLWPVPEGTLPEAIFLTEGESDCIVLLHLGLPAFALAHGAGGVLKEEHVAALKQRGVRRATVCFDADAAGRSGARKLAEVLQDGGLAVATADLDVLGLVDPLAGEKDVRDAWRRLRDPEVLREQLEQASTSANLLCPLKTEPLAEQILRRHPAREVLTCARVGASLESLPLLGRDGYIVKGWGHILSGYPKCGKTELLAACVQGWLAAGTTVLWLTEESESVWVQRLARWGSVPEGLYLTFALGADPAALLAHAAEGSEDVVVLDTVRNLLGLKDENDNSEIARALGAWEASLRGRTRIYVHHENKAGGEHGHAIAGGGAFLGMADRALEVRFDDQSQRRRRITVHSRIAEAPDLLYELTDEGNLVALGDPGQVASEAVQSRVLELLTNEWQKTREVYEALGEPRPSLEQVRQALTALAQAGTVERDPAVTESAERRTVRWRLAQICSANGPVLKLAEQISSAPPPAAVPAGRPESPDPLPWAETENACLSCGGPLEPCRTYHCVACVASILVEVEVTRNGTVDVGHAS